MRRDPTCATALILVVGLMAASAVAQDGEAGREQTAPLLFNDSDLLFLHHMSVHHEQAVLMSLMVPERTDRDDFIRFADYVRRAQAAEITSMQALLDLGADRGLAVPDHGPHGDPPMSGMLSTAQIDALEASSGAEFERLWLEGMIYHHEGAIDMSQAQQRQQLATGRRPHGLAVLVEEILVEQRAEIDKMNAWLSEWGLDGNP